MTTMPRIDQYPTTPRYLGPSELGTKFGVSASAVNKWVDRYPPGSDKPFPAPDEIREWRAGMPGRGAGGGRPRKQDD